MSAGSPRPGLWPALTWVTRRGSLPVILTVITLSAAAATAPGQVGTPQLSGAEAPLSLAAALGTVAGFVCGYLAQSREALAEARASRPLGRWRGGMAGGLLLFTGLVAPLGGLDGWDWAAYRNVMVMAGLGGLLVRFTGPFLATVVFAAYLGACLFAGVPLSGPARWWALLLHPAPTMTLDLALTSALAVACTWLATRPRH